MFEIPQATKLYSRSRSTDCLQNSRKTKKKKNQND